ncbi:MAG: hypothetical protein HRT89_16200 [Lentisphaeria bacterium]|nr:hypothetical protein [Lentisphaeria bacterium]NQZ69601.1 hypothetical protein [Lentisphaeria bacterium]
MDYLALIGIFIWGTVLSTIFHELGHLIACYACKGTVREFVIQPFGWSWVRFDKSPKFETFVTWAGLGGQIFFSTAVYFIVFYISGYKSHILLACLALSYFEGGAYYLFSTWYKDGDPGFLMSGGTSKVLLYVIGVFLVLISIILSVYILPWFSIYGSYKELYLKLFITLGPLTSFVVIHLYRKYKKFNSLVTSWLAVYPILIEYPLMYKFLSSRVPQLEVHHFETNTALLYFISGIALVILLCYMNRNKQHGSVIDLNNSESHIIHYMDFIFMRYMHDYYSFNILKRGQDPSCNLRSSVDPDDIIIINELKFHLYSDKSIGIFHGYFNDSKNVVALGPPPPQNLWEPILDTCITLVQSSNGRGTIVNPGIWKKTTYPISGSFQKWNLEFFINIPDAHTIIIKLNDDFTTEAIQHVSEMFENNLK